MHLALRSMWNGFSLVGLKLLLVARSVPRALPGGLRKPRACCRSCMRHRKPCLAVFSAWHVRSHGLGRVRCPLARCRVAYMGGHDSRQPPCSHAAVAAVNAELPDMSSSALLHPVPTPGVVVFIIPAPRAGDAAVCCGTSGPGRPGLLVQRAVGAAGRGRRRADALGRHRVPPPSCTLTLYGP